MGSKFSALLLWILASLQFSEAEGPFPTVEQYIGLVCFGQGVLTRDETLSLFDFSPAEQENFALCKEAISCDHAVYALLEHENTGRDADSDGIPCEREVCKQPLGYELPIFDGRSVRDCRTMLADQFLETSELLD